MRSGAKYLTLALLLGLLGCRRDMARQPRYQPLQASEFFPDGMASRPPPAGTIARGELRADEHFFTGRANGAWAATFPAPVTAAQLERGRERYEIYCAVCHGATGSGDGMVAQRGFPAPPTFHQERLRQVPPGYIYGVITHGFGVMYSYAARVEPPDRWAIAAYIRALQLSQKATLADVPEAARADLEKEAGSP